MKLLLSFVILSMFGFVAAQAANLDGNYKMASWLCTDGSQPSTPDVVSRVVDSTFLEISSDQIIIILKFDGSCEVRWSGEFKILEKSLNISEMTGQATPACHYNTKDKEPSISFQLETKQEDLILSQQPSLSDSCATGSVRTYKKIKYKLKGLN